jgi:uncharacterized protein YcaQ
MPSSPATISLAEARRLALRAQGLADVAAPFGVGMPAALRTIHHLGYVQIDTISVIERAHHHVLWSRIPGYKAKLLQDLQEKERAVFEYWNHAASYLPMRDFRFSIPLMRRYRKEGHWSEDCDDMAKAKRRLLELIRRNGPLLLRDVESKKMIESWWNAPPSKIERRALHELWMGGQVMVRHRQGFQKVFDLPERIIPEQVDRSVPSKEETAAFHIRRGLRALGLARLPELHYLQDAERVGILKARLKELIKDGSVTELRIAEIPDVPCYALAGELQETNPILERRLHILSPFDNLVIQRQRLRWLFDFDYLIECYVPADKRRFGYFVLPLLWGDQFIGRMDCKADRGKETLVIRNLVFEAGFNQFGDLGEQWTLEMHRFMEFQGCSRLEIPKGIGTKPRKLFEGLPWSAIQSTN